MQRTLLTPRTIVTMDSQKRILHGSGIIVRGNSIEKILSPEELKTSGKFDGEVVSSPSLVAIPGFIQTHIHLCQTLFRGLADDLQLLDWLRLKIFPFEAAHDERSMYASAIAGVAELVRSGTTTIMDMGSVHHQEQVIRAVVDGGIRAFLGKAMMDMNELYPRLKEPTKDSVRSTLHFAEEWHNKAEGRLRYAVAPRFILSCTDELLHEAFAMTSSFPGMLFHTHAAENRHEMDAVRKRCGMDNVEYFDKLNILHSNTVLAHCIWLNDREVGLMAERNAHVAHCPSSNLKLGSGIARIPDLLSKGINVSLGADGAPCNNTLDMFQEMRLAALMQKPIHGPESMNADSVLTLATMGGARALGIEKETGSIEPGKKADIVLLDLNKIWNSYSEGQDIYSTIVYSGSPDNVQSVMIDGRWILRDGALTTIDQEKVVESARLELNKLLKRIQA